jgi:starch synthase (maltosyl-transferring)
VLISTLNAIRHRHAALHSLRTIHFHPTNNSEIIAFTKADGDDRVLVVCSLNPHSTVEGEVYLDLGALGLPHESLLRITDEITGAAFTWGSTGFVRLPPDSPAHVASIGLA